MLGDAATIALVADLLAPAGLPLVLDPVMVAKGGARLLAADAVAALKRHLLPLAAVLTPNIPEAEALTGMAITDLPAMHHAAEALLTLGVPAVLLKGGHMPGDRVIDLLATVNGTELFEHPRLQTRHTHGTGCTPCDRDRRRAGAGDEPVARGCARHRLCAGGDCGGAGLGAGHGPLNHAVLP